MRKLDYVFTSESVSEGHPDKVCDRISDAIVDAFLTEDPHARAAVETLCTTNFVVLAGEVRGPESLNHGRYQEIARAAIKEIGYEQRGFHWKDAEITSHIHSQSPDIAVGAGGTIIQRPRGAAAEDTTSAARRIAKATETQSVETEMVSSNVRGMVDLMASSAVATTQTRAAADGLFVFSDAAGQPAPLDATARVHRRSSRAATSGMAAA